MRDYDDLPGHLQLQLLLILLPAWDEFSAATRMLMLMPMLEQQLHVDVRIVKMIQIQIPMLLLLLLLPDVVGNDQIVKFYQQWSWRWRCQYWH